MRMQRHERHRALIHQNVLLPKSLLRPVIISYKVLGSRWGRTRWIAVPFTWLTLAISQTSVMVRPKASRFACLRFQQCALRFAQTVVSEILKARGWLRIGSLANKD